ncbi:MAG: hypothetical protein IPN53_25205 [Comamonadaceae bacterium]|nr:hypothetical protein [Comamonadaceae bacterium]
MNTQTDLEQNETLTASACTSLFGLALKALLSDGGKHGALAALQKIEDGKAFVKCEVVFNKSGMTIEGMYHSHGNKAGQHLFSANLRNPPPAQVH